MRIATLVRAARAEGGPVLLLDGGDAIQGGALETAYWSGDRALPEPMMAAMTRLGYDAMAVGNHEFSSGPDALARARAAAGFPWLAANVVRDDGTPAFGTSIVKVLGGVRVGVIGLTTPAVPALEDPANVAGPALPLPARDRQRRGEAAARAASAATWSSSSPTPGSRRTRPAASSGRATRRTRTRATGSPAS